MCFASAFPKSSCGYGPKNLEPEVEGSLNAASHSSASSIDSPSEPKRRGLNGLSRVLRVRTVLNRYPGDQQEAAVEAPFFLAILHLNIPPAPKMIGRRSVVYPIGMFRLQINGAPVAPKDCSKCGGQRYRQRAVLKMPNELRAEQSCRARALWVGGGLQALEAGRGFRV